MGSCCPCCPPRCPSIPICWCLWCRCWSFRWCLCRCSRCHCCQHCSRCPYCCCPTRLCWSWCPTCLCWCCPSCLCRRCSPCVCRSPCCRCSFPRGCPHHHQAEPRPRHLLSCGLSSLVNPSLHSASQTLPFTSEFELRKPNYLDFPSPTSLHPKITAFVSSFSLTLVMVISLLLGNCIGLFKT